jgi:acyl dehydratase
MEITHVGQKYEENFSISQKQVNDFAILSGDSNPIHLDKEYASGTIFKKPIVHGFLSSSIFSKVFGTIFPGEGTLYLEQNMKFNAPVYPDEVYQAEFTVIEILIKNKAKLSTKIKNSSGLLVVDGEAIILNKNKIIGI